MRFAGRISKSGRSWVIEVPMLDLVTRSPTKKEASRRVSEVIESLVNKEGFKVDVYPGREHTFEVGSSDVAALSALFLRRQRLKSGLTLDEVAKRLGLQSHNAYARYEQGRSVPSVTKLFQLLSAVSPEQDFLLVESRGEK